MWGKAVSKRGEYFGSLNVCVLGRQKVHRWWKHLKGKDLRVGSEFVPSKDRDEESQLPASNNILTSLN